jgi:hypothetical protein
MHGVVSLLDQQYTSAVEDLWQKLEEHCGLTGIKVTPYPHFSWQIAEEYNWPVIETTLVQLASEIKPFAVDTTGLAIFSGEKPVVYIPVIRSPALSDLHWRLWEQLSEISDHPSPYYAPESWVPHITLAHLDVTVDQLGCLVDLLAYREYNWRLWIDNLAVIIQPVGEIGMLWNRFPLQG